MEWLKIQISVFWYSKPLTDWILLDSGVIILIILLRRLRKKLRNLYKNGFGVSCVTHIKPNGQELGPAGSVFLLNQTKSVAKCQTEMGRTNVHFVCNIRCNVLFWNYAFFSQNSSYKWTEEDILCLIIVFCRNNSCSSHFTGSGCKSFPSYQWKI